MNQLLGNFSRENIAKNIFFAIVLLKMLAYIAFVNSEFKFWTTFTDADRYDAFVHGLASRENAWGHFLKLLNNVGLYSRWHLSALIWLLNCFAIPWFFARASFTSVKQMRALEWCTLVVVSIYPTLNVYSVDIYRETPMVIAFLMFLYFAKQACSFTLVDWLRFNNTRVVIAIVMLGGLLLAFRFYLAAALFMSVGLIYFADLKRRFALAVLAYFSGLYLGLYAGIYDSMIFNFRPSQAGAGGAYGIDFTSGIFLINFIKSYIFNVYGLYFYSPLSVVVFVVESLPALLLTIYVFCNRKFSDRYASFLIFFMFIYSGLWSVGIDVIGTAVRYRIFSYLALLLAAYHVYQRKVEFGQRALRHDLV